MSDDRPTIEEVLPDWAWPEPWAADDTTPVDALRTATTDGPIVSADGTLVVHRADPELAENLRSVCADERQEFHDGATVAVPCGNCWYCRAARLVAGDPKEEA